MSNEKNKNSFIYHFLRFPHTHTHKGFQNFMQTHTHFSVFINVVYEYILKSIQIKTNLSPNVCNIFISLGSSSKKNQVKSDIKTIHQSFNITTAAIKQKFYKSKPETCVRL